MYLLVIPRNQMYGSSRNTLWGCPLTVASLLSCLLSAHLEFSLGKAGIYVCIRLGHKPKFCCSFQNWWQCLCVVEMQISHCCLCFQKFLPWQPPMAGTSIFQSHFNDVVLSVSFFTIFQQVHILVCLLLTIWDKKILLILVPVVRTVALLQPFSP